MSRSMCILFVALAIFQAVVAGVLEHREIVNLELTKVASAPTDLFNGERGSCSAGLFLYGTAKPGYPFWYYVNYEYNNYSNTVMELTLRLQLPSGNVVEFVDALSIEFPEVLFCATSRTLGSSMAEVIVKIPPYKNPNLQFGIGAH